jgi:hypothetical protein
MGATACVTRRPERIVSAQGVYLRELTGVSELALLVNAHERPSR